MKIVGATIPGVKARYVITDEAAHKAGQIAFHESEANCNTCLNLRRVTRPKRIDGFLYGECASATSCKDVSPYASRMEGSVMAFHPDDPMHMPFYESRFRAAVAIPQRGVT